MVNSENPCGLPLTNFLLRNKNLLAEIEYGLSNQEIADRMGITVPTVKSHYTQAIKALRNAIESLIMWFPVIWIYLID